MATSILHPTSAATTLRQEILDTIMTVRRLRLMVIIPAAPRRSGSPLPLAFLFIQPFLSDWDELDISWGLSVRAHPDQRQTYIQIDISTFPGARVWEGRGDDFAFPVYVLNSDREGRNWQFYRYATRRTRLDRGLVGEIARLTLGGNEVD
ncbi:uncharacterized protein N7515_009443 [Penicillium bovifimosum]|uniref:Uncharacterized protein n=1 Tax=Penicillium bovifimosum TaxID=126998 RepID=A0A9W9GKL4_9EURO|nr:uncharacterized protein N7515_009443 [Penicillium bovifimosum]KAJ5121482.1 hypothetical protein N7515_009443 [Penicillium bovifimosum]